MASGLQQDGLFPPAAEFDRATGQQRRGRAFEHDSGTTTELGVSHARFDNAAHQRLLDEHHIAATVIRLARAQDTKDWNAYESCLDDQVLIEQPMDPSWVPRKVPAREWTRRAASTLGGFDVTQHCLSNMQINSRENDADVEVELLAHHEIAGVSGNVYTLGGRYYISLIRRDNGWRISARRLQVNWESGNLGLTQLARERVVATRDRASHS